MVYLRFILLFFCGGAHLCFAGSSSQAVLLENGLNMMIRLSDEKLSTDDCDEVHQKLEDVSGRSESLEESLVGVLWELYGTRCIYGENDVGLENLSSDKTYGSSSEAWLSEPRCNGSSKVINCEYNHESGRGLFILEQPSTNQNPNFLVCAQSAEHWKNVFEGKYSIANRCQVSSLYWRGYQSLDGDAPMRSDVKGVRAWTYRTGRGKPIRFPDYLAKQCDTVFPNAAFCTPSLIVLENRSSDVVDSCYLSTRKTNGRFLIFKYSSHNSRWFCESHDLSQKVVKRRLSRGESSCIPDLWGNVPKSCKIPYIPETSYQRVTR